MNKNLEVVYQFLTRKAFNNQALLRLKKQLAKAEAKGLPRNSYLLKLYRQLVKQGQVEPSRNFENLLRLKKIRTLSGVAPVAVLTKPYPCPGKCIYCPLEPGVPKSYLSDEPAVERAKGAKFDPQIQVSRRIKQYYQTGHTPEKIELIVIGGSFSYLPTSYKRQFIKACFEAANERRAKTLLQAQKVNETAKQRLIGITLETRPDMITPQEIKLMRQLGATRVEIGVQSLNDQTLKLVKRGHGVKATIKATRLLKDAGLKICYHLMPNLPGSDLKQDELMFKQVFSDPDFKPDMLKIYPCVVLEQAELYKWYQQGKYQAYTDKQLIKLLVAAKAQMPEWVRINRVIRDIPKGYIMAGSQVSNLRQVLAQELERQGKSCQCIRCREVKNCELKIENCELKIRHYSASGGQEYFLQYVDKSNRLYALLRLRLVKTNQLKNIFPVLDQAAIIRELHTFGRAEAIGQTGQIQHQGLGEQLLLAAEKIAKKQGFKKMVVIAGVGAREYYRKFGYQLEQTYLVKAL